MFRDFKARNISTVRIFYGIIFDRGMSAVLLFRIANWFYRHHLKVFAVLTSQANMFFNRCELDYRSRIGNGFRIYHAVGLVMADFTAGENFTVCQNCTIGKAGKPDENGNYCPKIGNNVTIFPGAVVAGNIKIGDNCRIGANVTVTMDVPPDSTVKFPSPVVSQ